MDEPTIPAKRVESPPRPLIVFVVLLGLAGGFNLVGFGLPGTWPFSVAAGVNFLVALALAWMGKRPALYFALAGCVIDLAFAAWFALVAGGWVLLAVGGNLHIYLMVIAVLVATVLPVVRNVFDKEKKPAVWPRG